MKTFPFIVVAALLTLVGCDSGAPPKGEPILPKFYLVVPASDQEWQKSLVRGFLDEAHSQSTDVLVGTYTQDDPRSIIEAAKLLRPITSIPVCVVVLRRDVVRQVNQDLLNDGIHIITIGSDDGTTSRAGHAGYSSTDCAKRWNTIRKQIAPNAKVALFVFGTPSFKEERLQGAFFGTTLQVNRDKFENSKNPMKYLMRKAKDVSAQDVSAASIVTAIGEDALKKCIELGAKNLVVVDSSRAAFDWANGGVNRYLIAPDYYLLGQRAMKLAVERYTNFSLETPINEYNYSDSFETPLLELKKAVAHENANKK